MKKRILSIVLILTCAVGIMAGCGSNTNGENASAGTEDSGNNSSLESEAANADFKQTTFIAASGYPYNHTWADFTKEMLDEFTELSEGAYSYDLYEGGELVALGGELDALRSGTCQIAASFTPFSENRCHYGDVTLLPATKLNGEISTKAHLILRNSDRIIADGKTFYELEFTDNGIVGFYYPATEPYNLCVGEGIELETADDLNGSLRFRSPARLTNIFSENFGITPITISTYEVYDSMSRGAIDGVILSPDWNNVGITEIISTVYDVGIGSCCSGMAMTIETWESFPEEFRTAFEENYENMMLENASIWADTAEENWASLEEAGGQRITYDEMDESLREAYDQACVDTWLEYIDTMEAEGYAGKEAALLWRDAVVEAGGEFPQEIMELE